MRCPYIEETTSYEHICGLTGVSVAADCGAIPQEPCMPRMALRYLLGMLELTDHSTKEAPAIMATAEAVEDKWPELDQRIDIEQMSRKQVESLLRRLGQKKEAFKRARYAVPALLRRQEELLEIVGDASAEIEDLAQRVTVIRAGRVADEVVRQRRHWNRCATIGLHHPRKGEEEPADERPVEKQRTYKFTPEQRKRMSEGQKGRWARERAQARTGNAAR